MWHIAVASVSCKTGTRVGTWQTSTPALNFLDSSMLSGINPIASLWPFAPSWCQCKRMTQTGQNWYNRIYRPTTEVNSRILFYYYEDKWFVHWHIGLQRLWHHEEKGPTLHVKIFYVWFIYIYIWFTTIWPIYVGKWISYANPKQKWNFINDYNDRMYLISYGKQIWNTNYHKWTMNIYKSFIIIKPFIKIIIQYKIYKNLGSYESMVPPMTNDSYNFFYEISWCDLWNPWTNYDDPWFNNRIPTITDQWKVTTYVFIYNHKWLFIT